MYIADYSAEPDIFLIKTEGLTESFVYEKIQISLAEDHFIFSLKADRQGQVCFLYDPGNVQDPGGGWCVTIGKFHFSKLQSGSSA